MKRKILAAVLALMMVVSVIQPLSASADTTYEVTVTASATTVEPGDTVTLTTTIKKDGVELSEDELSSAGLSFTLWADSWNDHSDG
ncbi:MAG: hypothetical protein LUH09_09120, partial [Clostridiales bacterium]|nr:hypothetical protein [Clostridiales bacterium]